MTVPSNPLTTGPSRAPARAMLKGVGFSDADLKKPLIGVANTWIEIGPCNFHLRELAAHVKDGIRAAGGTPMEFNTVSISDGITMNTEGMKTLAGEPGGDRRTRSSWSRAATASTGRSCWSAVTRRFPAASWRWRG